MKNRAFSLYLKKHFLTFFVLEIFFLSVFCFFSCTLKYDENINAEENNPEFVFSGAKLIRYENNKQKAVVTTEYVEQYKNSDETYAKNVEFKTLDSKGNVETEGSCGLLYFDSKRELYELYDDIKLFNTSRNTNFYAKNLKWNGKTEQLTSGKTDMVRLEKEDTVIIGSGFSASGVSGKYVFTGFVNGNIVTKSQNEENANDEKGEETAEK